MPEQTYEIHKLAGQKLPIITHYFAVKGGGSVIANWHENIEILYFIKGCGQVICNSVVYDMQEGEIFIVNSNLLHGILKDKECEYYCLIVDSDFLSSNDLPIEKIEFEAIVRSQSANMLFENLIREINAQSEYRVAAIRAHILNLMIHLARNHASLTTADEKPQGGADESIKQAIACIKADPARHLTLEELANEVGLSKYYFAREFKKVTGMTVVGYINATRCRYAQKLLLSQQYSIHEIASMCGFENNSYFSKTYKSVMGCLPSEAVKFCSSRTQLL